MRIKASACWLTAVAGAQLAGSCTSQTMSAWIRGTTSMPCGTSALTSCCAMGTEGCRSLGGPSACSRGRQQSWLRSGMRAQLMSQFMAAQSVCSLPGCAADWHWQCVYQLIVGAVSSNRLDMRTIQQCARARPALALRAGPAASAGWQRDQAAHKPADVDASHFSEADKVAASCLEHDQRANLPASNLTHFLVKQHPTQQGACHIASIVALSTICILCRRFCLYPSQSAPLTQHCLQPWAVNHP